MMGWYSDLERESGYEGIFYATELLLKSVKEKVVLPLFGPQAVEGINTLN